MVTFTAETWDEIAELFAAAVAQGMHSPFPLDSSYWGRHYAQKLELLLAAKQMTSGSA